MPEDYTVRQGDCISSIAFERGHFWNTIWNDAGNASLKSTRRDPNILMEGDVVHIPDLRIKEIACAADQRHRLKRKGVPARLRMQFMQEETEPPPSPGSGSSNDFSVSEEPAQEPAQRRDRPRANIPFMLDIDGKLTRDATDGEGRIDIPLPPDARQGTIVLEPGTPREAVLQLTLGTMDPISEVVGLRKRLNNLGFQCGEAAEMTPELESALRDFQQKYGLQVTGESDQATRDKLVEVHGS